MPSPRPVSLSSSGRRAFLLGSLGLVTAVGTGCTLADPRVDGAARTPPTTPGPSRSGALRPSSTPTFAGAVEAAREEQGLADLCAALLTGPRAGDLGAGQRRRLASVRDAHDRHAAALRGPKPTSRPSGPVPAREREAGAELEDLNPDRSLALIGRRERALAQQHRATAARTTGSAALLWGSLAVAADGYGRTLAGAGPDVAPAEAPRPVPVLSDVAAMQALVEQLHALVYGYQLALGRLPGGSAGQRRGRSGLRSARVLRDRLGTELARRAVPVPVAEAAYVPSTPVRDAASAGKLLRQMETALLPFCGLWLAAAATPSQRERALRALIATTERASGWGAAPQVWPGWPD